MYQIWKSFVFLKMGRKKELSAGYQHKCVIIIIFREFNFLHNYYQETMSGAKRRVGASNLHYIHVLTVVETQSGVTSI